MDLVLADEIQTCSISLIYESDMINSMPPLTFIFLTCNFINSSQKINNEENQFKLGKSSTSVNCSALFLDKNLNMKNNSIILYPQSGLLSEIIHFECFDPSPYILAYFFYDEQYLKEIINNKEIKKAILRKVEYSLIKSQSKRSLQGSLEDFYDLVYNLEGCVACAMIDYDIDSMTSEELSKIYILFISYTQAIEYSVSRVRNNTWDGYLILKAALMLLNNKNFKESYNMCTGDQFNYLYKEYIYDESDLYFKQLERYIIKILDFYNACFEMIMIYNDYNEVNAISDYFSSIHSVYLITFFNTPFMKELDWRHNSYESKIGRMIEAHLTIKSKKNYDDTYVKLCFYSFSFIVELKILLRKYSIFGDIPGRFILGNKFNCNPKFYDQIHLKLYHSSLSKEIFKEESNGMGAKYNKPYRSIDIIEYGLGTFIYSYTIEFFNCYFQQSNLCKYCNPGYCLKDNKCFQCINNCLIFDQYLHCIKCILGFGFDSNYNCVECIQNCKVCDTFSNCLICNDYFYLNSNNDCSPCKENCKSCTFNYCRTCNPEFGLDLNNNCIRCTNWCKTNNNFDGRTCLYGFCLKTGENSFCEKCLDACLDYNNNSCFSCEQGSYLNYESDYAICEKCGDHCLICSSSNKCDQCEFGYQLSKDNEKNCIFDCQIKSCRFCNTLGLCEICNYGYFLTADFYCERCISFCMECSPKICRVCEIGYFLNNRFQCEHGPQDCEKPLANNFCIKCFDSNVLTQIFDCERRARFFYNKLICIESGGYYCRKCASGYYLTVDLRCGKCIDNTCLECENFGCIKCFPGNFLDYNLKCYKCSINCSMCFGLNYCIKCIEGYFTNDSVECFRCTTLNCKQCSNKDLCEVCEGGYYLNNELNCISCKINSCLESNSNEDCIQYKSKCELNQEIKCKKYSSEFICEVCIDGYFITSNHDCEPGGNIGCIKISNNNCNECLPGYFLSTNFRCHHCYDYNCLKQIYCNTCEKCKEGYYVNKEHNSCTICNRYCKNCPNGICSECSQGYYLNNLMVCNKCTANCKICPNGICFECSEGYYLNSLMECNNCFKNCKKCFKNNECFECFHGFFLKNNSECSECGWNCFICLDFEKCSFCNSKYYVNNEFKCSMCDPRCKNCKGENYCTSCEELYFLNEFKCVQKTVFKCQTYSNFNECIKCENGYFLYHSSTCVYCNAQNCRTCNGLNKCTECEDGYYLNKKFECIYSNIIGCKNWLDNDRCIECGMFYYLNEYFRCDLCYIPGCIQYSSCIECTKCHSFYFLTDQKTCMFCIRPCSNCLNLNDCTSCDSDYFLYKSRCYSMKNTCSICDYQISCKTCYYNYFLSTGEYSTNDYSFKCKYLWSGTMCRGCKNELIFYSEEGCACINGYYRSKFDSCLKCHRDCFTCSDYKTCIVCIALNANYFKNLGCECNQGFYRDKAMHNADACIPCNSICKECESKNICKICIAFNSKFIENLGCECDSGYYQVSSMDNSEACIPCEFNCIKCTNNDCLICEDNYYLFKNKCIECGKLLAPNVANAFFLDSFTEVEINFEDKVPLLDCQKFFGNNIADTEKFGKDYKCKTISKKKIFIQLGTGSSLINETVEISNIFLKNPNDECRIKIKFEFLSPLPAPTAIIFAPSKISVDFDLLIIDGKLSYGGYNSFLKFEWIITSESFIINNYSNTTNASIVIPGFLLNKGTIKVMLTVTNKFGVKDTAIKEILCDTNILIIYFNTPSNYSCKASQQCEYFINQIYPIHPNDVFNYSWEISSGKNLMVKPINLLNESSLIIKPNTFKQGIIGFTVTAINQLGIYGSSQIFVKIIYENPVIKLSRSPGSISSAADFYCDASQSFDPNLNCRGDNDCLKFNWICFISKNNCEFKYDRFNDYISIPKSIVGKILFNKFVLSVTSGDNFKSNLSMKYEIIDFNNVPNVLLRDYFSKKTPSRISSTEDFVVEAVFLYSEVNQYLKKWVLNNETDKVLSENLIVSISKDYIKAGLDYELTLSLMANNVSFNYFYNFNVNNPPRPGELLVEPESGFALFDKFTATAYNWDDLELDYPLLYAFGFYINESKINLMPKQPNQIFLTFLSHIGDPIYFYVLVYDSLGDFKELTQKVSVENSNSTIELLQKMKIELATEMPHNFLSIIYGIAIRILNKDFYTYGSFSSSGLSEISDLQDGFDLSLIYLNKYIDKIQISKDLIIHISKILEELTLNPNLRSSKNAKQILKTINNLLEKCQNFGLVHSQINSLYQAIENSFNFSSELISIKRKDLNALTTVYEKLNKARAKNLYDDFSEVIKSKNAQTQLKCLESYKLDDLKYSLINASVTFPSNISESNINHHKKIVLSLTFISLEKSENLTQNLIIITIFDLEKNEQISVNSSAEIDIEIPFDHDNYSNKNYSCLYYNYNIDEWENQGCFMSDYTQYSIICKCKHLSTFTAGVFQINSESNNTYEQTADKKQKHEFVFLSSDGIIIHLCLTLFFIYLVFAIICYLKDRKENESTHEASSKAKIKSKIDKLNNLKPNNNVPVDYIEHEINENQINLEVNIVKENDEIILSEVEENEKKQKIDKYLVEDAKIVAKKKKINPDAFFINNEVDAQINKVNFVNSNLPVDYDENMSKRNVYKVKEKDQIQINQENNDNFSKLSLRNNYPHNNVSTLKKGLKAITEGFKELSIYFYTDPNHCRLFRCSSVFFKLIGGIFLITCFYNSVKIYFSSRAFTVLSILSTFIVINTILIIFYFVFKETDLGSGENFNDKLKKQNNAKVLISVSIYTVSMISFISGTWLLVQNLDPELNKELIKTIGIGIPLELIISLIAKNLFRFLCTFCSRTN